MSTSSLPGGDLELAVLQALWELGEASGRSLYDRIGAPNGLVYTTVAKVLDRLCAKSLVSRRLRGKSYVYRPKVARERVEADLAGASVRKLLGGAPRPAIAALVDAVGDLDPALLDELAALVDAKRRSPREP